jgi:predicted NUDIX family NTP pyrophosphohydrolase
MKRSAGILMYRFRRAGLQVLLVHPGGPFWAKKDLGAWSIPKGEFGPEEDAFGAAKREFREELGQTVQGRFIPLEPVRQRAGKVVHAWAVEGDLDADRVESNEFELEWPPKSGRIERFPEVDRAEWFDLETARSKINQGQVRLIEQLETLVVAGQ